MSQKVNINKAEADELVKIIHIGKVRAAAIIAARPFRDIYELSNVKGLGKVRMKAILKQQIAFV